MLESLVRQLKVRRFANNFITIPCLLISIAMLFIQPTILWVILAGFNLSAMGLNWVVIRMLERQILSAEGQSEADRKKTIDELYGR
jgi:ABC-type bacteriocin/lantibiotic exporter with double-glycine peptidase domain